MKKSNKFSHNRSGWIKFPERPEWQEERGERYGNNRKWKAREKWKNRKKERYNRDIEEC